MDLLTQPEIEIKRSSCRRKARLHAAESCFQVVEVDQGTELFETILYAALGASGLAGVVVAFL